MKLSLTTIIGIILSSVCFIFTCIFSINLYNNPIALWYINVGLCLLGTYISITSTLKSYKLDNKVK